MIASVKDALWWALGAWGSLAFTAVGWLVKNIVAGNVALALLNVGTLIVCAFAFAGTRRWFLLAKEASV